MCCCESTKKVKQPHTFGALVCCDAPWNSHLRYLSSQHKLSAKSTSLHSYFFNHPSSLDTGCRRASFHYIPLHNFPNTTRCQSPQQFRSWLIRCGLLIQLRWALVQPTKSLCQSLWKISSANKALIPLRLAFGLYLFTWAHWQSLHCSRNIMHTGSVIIADTTRGTFTIKPAPIPQGDHAIAAGDPKASKLPRPPNAFILYRQQNHPIVMSQNPGFHNTQICMS